jgi:uncharacterized membrane protein
MKISQTSHSTLNRALVLGAIALEVVLTAHPAFAQVGGGTAGSSAQFTSLQSATRSIGANIGQIYQIGAYSAAGVALVIHGIKAMGASNNFNFMSMSTWVKGAGLVGLSGAAVGALTGTAPW